MSKRILIADDSSFWREQFRAVLERDPNLDVFEASDGSEAVQNSIKFRPDLVVLDYSMPVLDGLGAARELRRAMPKLPILLCTVDKSPCLEDIARESGVPTVFSKTEWPEMLSFIRQELSSGPRASETYQPTVA
jgi:CheY-like chemotaxis protein